MPDLIDPLYAIAIIAIAYTLASRYVIDKIVDRKKVKAIQDESKQLQKELAEASKSGNSARLEEVNKKYEQFMPKMLELSFSQLKPMIIIIPALAILMPIIRSTFEGFETTLPFYLPIFIQNFEHFPNWRNLFGPVGWFWICVIAAGIGISLISPALNKIKEITGLALSPSDLFGRFKRKEKNEEKPNSTPESEKNQASQNMQNKSGSAVLEKSQEPKNPKN